MEFIKKLISNSKFKFLLLFVFAFSFSEILIDVYNLKINPPYFAIFAGVMIFASKYLLDNKAMIEKRILTVSSIFSGLLAIALTIQSKITFSGVISAKIDANTIDKLAFGDFFRFLIIFVGIFVIYNAIVVIFKKHDVKILDDEKKDNKFLYKLRNCVIVSLAIFIPIFIYWLANYPGFLPQDAYNSLRMVMGDRTYSTQHPILFTLIVGNLIKSGISNETPNFGVAIYCIIQMICFSGTIGYFITWLKNKGVKFEYLMLVYLFFIAGSFFYTYAIILWKDTLFSLALLLMALLLYDLAQSDGMLLKKFRWILYFLFLSFIIFFWRNNGFYILVLEALALLFIYKKKLLVFSIINIIALIIFTLTQRGLYEKYKARELVEEALGVPLMQIARTYSLSGDVASGDMEVFDKVMTKEKMVSLYQPMIVDTLKWSKDFKREKLREDGFAVEYIKAWFHTMPKNFSTYVDSYLLSTYGFWSFGTRHEYEAGFDSYHQVVKNKYEIEMHDYFEDNFEKPLRDKYVSNAFIGAGTMFWIMLASASVLIIQKKNKLLIAYLPCFGAWATLMVATPVAFGLRYAFMFALTLPLFVIAPFFKDKIVDKKGKSNGKV